MCSVGKTLLFRKGNANLSIMLSSKVLKAMGRPTHESALLAAPVWPVSVTLSVASMQTCRTL